MPASARPVAMATMFCSATPTLKKRSGKASVKGATGMKPRSAVSRTMRGSRSASWTSACTNALRMSSVPYLAKGQRIVLIVHRHVMPADLALHEGDALSKCRMRDEDMRAPRRHRRDRVRDRGLVIAVNAVHVPAEGPPALLERLERDHVRGVAERLLAVWGDYRGQVVQPGVRPKHNRPPH